MTNFQSLVQWGWTPFFQQQLTLEEWETAIPARVTQQHRSQLELISETGELILPLLPDFPTLVVGDWLLLDASHSFLRLLERTTCFKRKSSGTQVQWQLIAANVDTAFIVCSMNEDFNLNRIERYLSLVNAAGVEPVIVLTKKDLAENAEYFSEQVQRLDAALSVAPVNALADDSTSCFSDWLRPGKTIAVLGSSGVGKSTLVNTLSGSSQQQTGSIREDDDKGRHTTTRRSLLPLPSGALILDTPGMRELQLADCHEGVAATFADIEALAQRCRFHDCSHSAEPGCAVTKAVTDGELESRRLTSYLKLMREEKMNTATLAQKRAQEKSFTKFVKNTMRESQKFKGR